MTYVPGLQNDLFVSYAHGDNADGWVTTLHERLKIRLRELLGVSPTIWRDDRRLGREMDFSDEIQKEVASTAVVIAVVSPSYLASAYCRLERQAFFAAAQSHGGLKVGNSFRIFKVVKTPEVDNGHRRFLPETLGFEFFRSPGGLGAGERESRSESREYQEILPVEAATPRTARSGGASGMHHRTTVRGVDLIGGIVSVGLGDRTTSDRA